MRLHSLLPLAIGSVNAIITYFIPFLRDVAREIDRNQAAADYKI